MDQQWLLAINGLHAPWADSLMWTVSRASTWIPLYVILVALMVYKHLPAYRALPARRAVPMMIISIACIFTAVGLADYISSGIIKPWVCRLRPTHEPEIENLLHIVRGYRGGLYGFVSSHAANTAALATIYTLMWRSLSTRGVRSTVVVALVLALYCALNCYSRMYLGVHYPGDLLGGLVVGILVAVGVYIPWRRYVGARVADADPAPPACS